MSVEAVLSRIGELQQLMGAATGGAVAPPTRAATSTAPAAPGSFAGALASASAAPAASVLGGDDASSAGDGAVAGGAPGAAGATGTSGASFSALPAGTPYGAEITAAAKRHGLDPALLAGLVKQESGFNPNAGSPAGARGLTQLMPATAAGLGVTNPLDPAQSIEGGAKYLRRQLDAFGGDTARALAAYNAGPGAVQRFGGVPPYAETQQYVRKVQAFAAAFRSRAATSTTAA